MSDKWWSICVACTAIIYTFVGVWLGNTFFKPKVTYPVQKFQRIGQQGNTGKAKDIIMPTMTRQIFMSDPYFRQFVTDELEDGEK